ncbi:helix-turn-helix domain-containing protein [Candidatus Poriferisodalis sp.]|uniref:helix-turn-helix domain-containing protein n=1 Tax=Candidatus Poriferisodalis sp. TaxID=3101277 RepID=UPI003B0129B8
MALGRRERRWTLAELAQRAGVSETTLRKVERGDLSVALGTALQAAALVGVRLFDHSDDTIAREAEVIDARLALLPSRVRRHAVNDHF